MENLADIEAKTATEIAKESAEISAQAAKYAAEAKMEATKQDIQDLKTQAQAKAQQCGQKISNTMNTVKDNIKAGTADALDKISDRTAQLADKLSN